MMTTVPPYSSTYHRQRSRSRPLKRTHRSLTGSILTIATILVFPGLLLNTILHQTAFLLPSTSSSLRTTPFFSFHIFYHAEAKEIAATNEWQLLSENDTIPAGLHVRMDLSTGEKWAKIPEDEERDEDVEAAVHPGDDYG